VPLWLRIAPGSSIRFGTFPERVLTREELQRTREGRRVLFAWDSGDDSARDRIILDLAARAAESERRWEQKWAAMSLREREAEKNRARAFFASFGLSPEAIEEVMKTAPPMLQVIDGQAQP
jgi:hypothetical protein